jgi:hypothetical protein
MMRKSIKQVFISISTLVKYFSWFLSEGSDLFFEKSLFGEKKKTSLKIVVAFHPKHKQILT